MWPMLIAAGISGVGSIFGANAQNKATREQNQIQREGLQLAREGDRRSAESDIMRKLAQTAYLRGGGAQESGPMSTPAGTLPSYGFGPRPASEAQVGAADTLEKLLMERMKQRVALPGGVTANTPNNAAQANLRMVGQGNNANTLEELIRMRFGTPEGY